jgi:predicted nucleic acid-binding protein
LIYPLDTNSVSDWLSPLPSRIETQVFNALRRGDKVLICQPVYYELTHGLIAKNHLRKMQFLRDKIIPLLEYVILENVDWLQAAQFWADADNKGKKLSDIDLLLAAQAHRLDAIVVSADRDFDILPVKHVDWRNV